MDSINHFLLMAPPLLLALTLHEYAHGYFAFRLGDPTARDAGRLTLNPISHLDPIGTITFFLINIGWAKPVPVNPRYFRNPRQDMLWVALAGPLTNLGLAVFSAVLLHVVQVLPLPVFLVPFEAMLHISIWVNLILFIFNLVPIPPLDGSKILGGLLPEQLARSYASFERYGFILLLLLVFTGVLPRLIFPVITLASNLLTA